MKKRVAIPVTNKQLSEYFGDCSHYEIFDTDGKITENYEVPVPVETGQAELPGWLEKMGVTDVITFKVSPAIIHLFASKKVNLFIGVPIDSPCNLIDDYLQGKLESDELIIQEITIGIEKQKS